MKHLALVLALALSPSLAVADDAPDHVVDAAGQNVSLDCGEGGKVAITGAGNTVTITGGCSKVAVTGSSNVVSIAAADKIAVTGSGNHVTYKKGYTKKSPKVARTGVGNKVARIK